MFDCSVRVLDSLGTDLSGWLISVGHVDGDELMSKRVANKKGGGGARSGRIKMGMRRRQIMNQRDRIQEQARLAEITRRELGGHGFKSMLQGFSNSVRNMFRRRVTY